jgi:hypothetical protein
VIPGDSVQGISSVWLTGSIPESMRVRNLTEDSKTKKATSN